MAAISTALLSQLNQGDHVVFQNDIYGVRETLSKVSFRALALNTASQKD